MTDPDPRAELAAANNADWYQMLFEVHGLSYQRTAQYFRAIDDPPAYHSRMTLLAPSLSADTISVIARESDRRDFGIKDSFGSLDLDRFGIVEASRFWGVGWVEGPCVGVEAVGGSVFEQAVPWRASMVKDAICLRLWSPHVKVIGVLVDEPDELVVAVQSRERRPLCPSCGMRCGRVHDRRDVKIRDLDSSGRSVTLVWKRRRLICDSCGARFGEHNATFERGFTARLARQLVTDARDMTISAVARRYGLSWHTIMTLVRTHAGVLMRHRRRRHCRLLLVDETSIQRRHRYVTVLVNGDTGEVLAMVAHRNKAALTAFFVAQGRRWCRGVHTVVSDGSIAYTEAIRQHIGHARHVLDRFHVIRWFQRGLTAVRRDIQRRPDGVKPRFDPDVFRARFLLLKRPDKLSAAEHERLHRLFSAHPRLKTAWDALAELHNLYLADDHQGALKALDRFCDLYSTGD